MKGAQVDLTGQFLQRHLLGVVRLQIRLRALDGWMFPPRLRQCPRVFGMGQQRRNQQVQQRLQQEETRRRRERLGNQVTHGPAQRRVYEGMAGKMGLGLLPVEYLFGKPLQPGRVNKERVESDVFSLAGPGCSRLDHHEFPLDDLVTGISILHVSYP